MKITHGKVIRRLFFVCDSDVMLVLGIAECLCSTSLLLNRLIARLLCLLHRLLNSINIHEKEVTPTDLDWQTYLLCIFLVVLGRLQCFTGLYDMFLSSRSFLCDRPFDLLFFACSENI